MRRIQLRPIDRDAFVRDSRPRLKRALIFGIPAFLIIAIASGATATLVLALIVGLGVYVPAWRHVPLGRFAVLAVVLVLAFLYPYYQQDMFEVPIFGGFPSVDTAVTMLIFVMMALGLNIVVGYAGLLDLGYVAFYAMGAYTAAWFASPHFSESIEKFHFGAVGVNEDASGFHISIWIVLLLAAIFTAIIGVIIGLPTLRLRGDYLAIVTLGFGEIMPQVALNGDNLFNTGFNLTNGPQGINPIDSPGFGSTLENTVGLPESYLVPGTGAIEVFSDTIRLYFWTGLVLVLFTVFCSVRLRDSRLGRAWIAIREDETAAAAMGVPLMRTKTWAYAAGAFFGGIAGAYYASFKAATFPADFYFNISVFILCMVILGGMGNIWGVIIGGGFLAYLNQEGLGNIGGWLNDHFSGQRGAEWFELWGTDIDVPLYQFGIFGVILVLVMLFKPEGLIPSARRKAEFQEGVADQPLYDVSHT
jgi:branched-chain amino acid transport system permease protein